MESACRSVSTFIDAMNTVVSHTTDAHVCTSFVQRTLPELLHTGNCLASAYTTPAIEAYARHLVYKHPDDRYVVVAMVWRPGQRTPIHDHGGVWCVEGVYQGQMDITQYHITPMTDNHVKAVPVRSITAGLGNVGALIPPYDYHVMANTSQETAITLHVYGGELKRCHVFIDDGAGLFQVQERELAYTSLPSVSPGT